MKIFYQILFFFFIGLSLFIIRDDVVSVIDNVASYFNKGNESQIIKFDDKKEVELPKKVVMPGALRVVNNILNINSDISLSKDKVILLTNEYRKANGNLKALVENNKLDLSAEKKLQDMFDKQYFEHISPTGIGVGDIGEEVGYEYILIGENLAMGNFKDEASLMNAWEASEGHRENIVNKNYTEIGVAVGKGKFEGKNIWMAVQHFGTPRSACPLIDEVLYGTISLNQTELQKMGADLTLRKEMIDKRVVYEGSTYSEQVDKYNSLIIPYNNLVTEIKKEIDNYNNQVRAFNLCLTSKQ